MASTTCSEDVTALVINVASVIQRGGVHHCLVVGHALPDARCHVLAVLHGVLLHFLNVGLLRCAISHTDALIVAHVERVSLLEGPEERLLFLLALLLGECDVRAVGRKVGEEAAALADCVGPWLLTVQNIRVLLGVLVAPLVLFAFVGVLRVAHLVQVREGLGLDTSTESRGGLGDGTGGRAEWNVLEFGLSDLLVRAGDEGTLLRVGAHAAKARVILAGVNVGVAKSVALELSKGLFRVFTTVDRHGTILADFVALFPVSLIVCAVVADGQSDRHREESVTLPVQN